MSTQDQDSQPTAEGRRFTPIPIPPTVPFLGNVPLMDKDLPIRTFLLLASQYGELFGFQFPDGRVTLHVTTRALVAQVSDDARFSKTVNRALMEVRNLAGDGLFTAFGEEVNWGKARELLVFSCLYLCCVNALRCA